MRKLLLGTIIYLCLPFHTFAQESVGFSDPDNIQPLLDYRLPEWGYTNFYLDFSTDGSFTNREYNAPNDDLSISLSPHYFRYKESESRISNASAGLLLNYDSFETNDSETSEEHQRGFDISLPFNLSEKLYKDNSDIFFTSSLFGILDFERDYERFIQDGILEREAIHRDRRFLGFLSIGLGYGRLRNVNPMIRSLRLSERYQALQTSQQLNNDDIVNASEMFSQRSTYGQVYDRPMKYFWRDLNNSITPDLYQLDPFDLLYLTDVASENIGQRLEGWEIGVDLDLRYNVSHHYRRDKLLSTEESNISGNYLELQPNMYVRWYRNFSLRHQLGFESTYRYYYDLKDSDFEEHDLTSELSWLYTITDRFITNTTFVYRYSKNDYSPPSYYHFGRVGVNLTYFIENKLSFFADVSYATQKIVETDESLLSRNFNFSAGLRYYFKRELF